MQASIVEIVDLMLPKHEKATLLPLLWHAERSNFCAICSSTFLFVDPKSCDLDLDFGLNPISISIAISTFNTDSDFDFDFGLNPISISIAILVFNFDLDFDFWFSIRFRFQVSESISTEVDFEITFKDL